MRNLLMSLDPNLLGMVGRAVPARDLAWLTARTCRLFRDSRGLAWAQNTQRTTHEKQIRSMVDAIPTLRNQIYANCELDVERVIPLFTNNNIIAVLDQFVDLFAKLSIFYVIINRPDADEDIRWAFYTSVWNEIKGNACSDKIAALLNVTASSTEQAEAQRVLKKISKFLEFQHRKLQQFVPLFSLYPASYRQMELPWPGSQLAPTASLAITASFRSSLTASSNQGRPLPPRRHTR